MDLRKLGWGGTGLINLAQDRDQWRNLVNTAMNLRVSSNVWKFLNSWDMKYESEMVEERKFGKKQMRWIEMIWCVLKRVSLNKQWFSWLSLRLYWFNPNMISIAFVISFPALLKVKLNNPSLHRISQGLILLPNYFKEHLTRRLWNRLAFCNISWLGCIL
jgi:hypothetical protein